MICAKPTHLRIKVDTLAVDESSPIFTGNEIGANTAAEKIGKATLKGIDIATWRSDTQTWSSAIDSSRECTEGRLVPSRLGHSLVVHEMRLRSLPHSGMLARLWAALPGATSKRVGTSSDWRRLERSFSSDSIRAVSLIATDCVSSSWMTVSMSTPLLEFLGPSNSPSEASDWLLLCWKLFLCTADPALVPAFFPMSFGGMATREVDVVLELGHSDVPGANARRARE